MEQPPRAPQLVLASASPRRAELLRQLGLVFTVRPSDMEELPRGGEMAAETVTRLALAKASRVAHDETLPVLGADTMVVVDSIRSASRATEPTGWRCLRDCPVVVTTC